MSEEMKEYGQHLTEIFIKNELFQFDEHIKHFNEHYLNSDKNSLVIRAERAEILMNKLEKIKFDIDCNTKKKYYRVQIENLEEKKQKLIETIKNIQTPFNDFVEELERLEARKKRN